jgi:hypothetical protein
LPRILLLEEDPPYRAWRHRLSAASTLLLDDWIWWLNAKREAWQREIAGAVAERYALSPRERGGDPGRS